MDTWAMSSGYEKKNMGFTLAKKATEDAVENDADEVVLEMKITNTPVLKLYNPARECIETGLTGDTPANPNDESNKIGSLTRETKYTTKKPEVFLSPRTHA